MASGCQDNMTTPGRCQAAIVDPVTLRALLKARGLTASELERQVGVDKRSRCG